MNLTVVTPPAIEPVTLEAALAQLHNPQEQDARISGLITAAREWAENYTNRAFIEQTLRVSGAASSYSTIALLRQPVISIEVVEYYDLDNVSQEIAEADYYVTAGGALRFVSGYIYPSVFCREDALQVEYIAGYGTTAMSVPQSIKQAILLGVDLEFSPLTPTESATMQERRRSLLDPYRVFEIA